MEFTEQKQISTARTKYYGYCRYHPPIGKPLAIYTLQKNRYDPLNMSISMKKVVAKKAVDIILNFELIEEFQPLLDYEQAPAEYFETLMNNEHYHDAVIFLAHAIPTREAVWWACVCSRHHMQDADVTYQLGLNAAEAWAYDSTEENRRICEKYVEKENNATPASWAATAAFWSGGSITAIDKPAMEPPPNIYAHAVAGAIIKSAGLGTPPVKEVEKRYKNYLKHGIDIANGGNG